MNSSVNCWEYFHCDQEYKEQCKVYQKRHEKGFFSEGWFQFNTLEGGPAKRGPCFKCEIMKKAYPEIYEIFKEESTPEI